MEKATQNNNLNWRTKKMIKSIHWSASRSVFAAALFALLLTNLIAFSQSMQKIKKMKTTDFNTTITVDQSPAEAYKAINNPRAWWSEEITGVTDKVNSEFDYHFQDVHRCKMKVIELVPDKKVVWLVEDNYFKFTKDKSEWKGTKIVFDISLTGKQTSIRFTHIGLVPQYECFEICRDAWTNYIHNSLRDLIATGKGKPNASGKPQTADELKLRKLN
jgi:hypothetical protein